MVPWTLGNIVFTAFNVSTKIEPLIVSEACLMLHLHWNPIWSSLPTCSGSWALAKEKCFKGIHSNPCFTKSHRNSNMDLSFHWMILYTLCTEMFSMTVTLNWLNSLTASGSTALRCEQIDVEPPDSRRAALPVRVMKLRRSQRSLGAEIYSYWNFKSGSDPTHLTHLIFPLPSHRMP